MNTNTTNKLIIKWAL